MSIHALHNGEVKSVTPYVKHNNEVKIASSVWAKVDGEVKQIWPEVEVVWDGTIYNQATLKLFRDLVEAGDTSLNAVVTADFTLTGEWTPISGPYAGTFDGGGHTIKGLTINYSDSTQVGLFRRLQSGTIKNLTLENVSVAGNGYVGALVGTISSATIENCVVSSGTVTDADNADSAYGVGGLVGQSYQSTVKDCANNGVAVIANLCSYAGGVVGLNAQNSTVENCNNAGSVTSAVVNGRVGGIVGTNGSTSSTIEGCGNTGTITGSAYGATVGGIAGFNFTGTIASCTNSGDVISVSTAGGIVGYQNNGTVKDSNNTGAVTSTSENGYAGGIVGQLFTSSGGTSTFENNADTGTVTGANITTV